MSTPTPATLKKQLDEKHASEITQQAVAASKRRSFPVTSETTEAVRPKTTGKKIEPSVSSSKTRKSELSKALTSKTTENTMALTNSAPKKPFKRTEHLTQKPLRDNPELQKLQEEFKEMETVNKQAGWYDRDRHGKQTKAQQNRATVIAQTVQKLRDAVGEKNIVDIGKGAEIALRVSAPKKMEAIKLLLEEGYKRYYIPIKQIGDANLRLTRVVLTAPGTTFKSVVTRKNEIVKLEISKSESRQHNTVVKRAVTMEKRERAMALKRSGYSNVAIGEALGINESSVRRLLAIKTPEKENN